LKNAILEKIINDNFILQDEYSLIKMTDDLIENLGSSSSKQRDYSYMILSTWISRSRNFSLYTKKQLVELGHISKSNIQKELGSSTLDDSIFLRSYSILILNDLTQIHEHQPYLSKEEIFDRLNLALVYIDKELDLRGFINEEKGWAHGIAHIADTFMILSTNKWLKEDQLHKMLFAILKKIKKPTTTVFIYSEEERLARSVVKIFINKVLSDQSIDNFLKKLTIPHRLQSSGNFVWENFDKNPWRYVLTSHQDELFAYRNLQNFLRSLYFQWKNVDIENKRKRYIQKKLYSAIKFIELGFYNKENGFFIIT
jgi:hypothetical protein